MHVVDETIKASSRSVLEQRMAIESPLCTTLVNLMGDTRKTSTILLRYIAAYIIIDSDKVLGILFSGLDGQSQNVVIITMRDMTKNDIAWTPWMKIAKKHHNTGQKSDEILPKCRHWIATNAQNKPIELAQVDFESSSSVLAQGQTVVWTTAKTTFEDPPYMENTIQQMEMFLDITD
jgi:hypothetical protein